MQYFPIFSNPVPISIRQFDDAGAREMTRKVQTFTEEKNGLEFITMDAGAEMIVLDSPQEWSDFDKNWFPLLNMIYHTSFPLPVEKEDFQLLHPCPSLESLCQESHPSLVEFQ